MSFQRFPPLPDESPREWATRVLAAFADGPPPCPYCGNASLRSVITCNKHRDLVKLDPFYNPALNRRTV